MAGTNKLRGLSPQARTIPTERPPLVDEVSAHFSGYRVSPGQRNKSPTVVNFGFLDRSRYFLELTPQLSSWGWVDPIPDPLLLRKNLVAPGVEPGPLGRRGGRYGRNHWQNSWHARKSNGLGACTRCIWRSTATVHAETLQAVIWATCSGYLYSTNAVPRILLDVSRCSLFRINCSCNSPSTVTLMRRSMAWNVYGFWMSTRGYLCAYNVAAATPLPQA
jgi:hypothetical protein